MDITEAHDIIKALSEGFDPFSGEELPSDSLYQNPTVIRALFVSVSYLEKAIKREAREGILPQNAGKPWHDVEDTQLIQEYQEGKTVRELSQIHMRTVGAVRSRSIKLGIISLR